MLAYSTRKSKRGGGSIQQSLDYLNPSYGTPNAPAGQNLLVERGGVARPMIGGFIPSVMKGVVNSGALLGPLVAIEAKRMMNGNGTRKRRGGGKTENWKRNYALARNFLRQQGKPSGPNISRYAALLRKDPAAAEAFLNEFKAREFAKQQEKAMKKTRRAPRKTKAPAVATAAPGAIRHVFYNSTGKVLGEEMVPKGQLSKLVVNVTGRVRDITEQIPVPNSFTIGEEIPAVNETMEAIAREAAMARPSEAFKKGKTKKSKGPLTTIAEGNETMNLTMPAANKEKGTRKVSNEWRAMYTQAKANLAAIGKNPTGPQISTLAAMRKRGESNAAYLDAYKQGIVAKPTAPPAELINLSADQAKRTYKLSNEYKSEYGKAKANLAAALGKNPKAHQIGTLAKIRKMGLPNAEYIEKMKQAAAAPPVVVNAVKQIQAPAAPVAAATAQAPGLLQTIMSMVAPAAAAEPAEATQKRQYKRSNEVVAAYKKAKANLAATGKKPKAQEIATLAAIRRRGESNSAFFNEYTRTPETVIDLNASSTEENE